MNKCILLLILACSAIAAVSAETHPKAGELRDLLARHPLEPRLPHMMMIITAASMESNRLGYLSYDNKRYGDAIPKFKEAVNLDPDNSFAWYNMACSYALMGNRAEAATNLKKAMQWEWFWGLQLMVDPDLDSLRSFDTGGNIFHKAKPDSATPDRLQGTYRLAPDGSVKLSPYFHEETTGYFCLIGGYVFLFFSFPDREDPNAGQSSDVNYAWIIAIGEFHAAEPTEGTPVSRPEHMVLVEGGSYTMGAVFSNSDENEMPRHSVTVSSFSMSKHEVTVAAFRDFVLETGYQTTAETTGGGFVMYTGGQTRTADATWKNPYFTQTTQDPVVMMSWYDAVEYCNWRSRREGLAPCYAIEKRNVACDWNADGYRLPTEAEWEFAARGGKLTKDYYVVPGGNTVGYVGWYEKNSGGKTHPIGEKDGNELLIFDMGGNAWEWCWDRYGKFSADAQKDPQGPAIGEERVIRGGGWESEYKYLIRSRRWKYEPEYSGNAQGFRIVRSMAR